MQDITPISRTPLSLQRFYRKCQKIDRLNHFPQNFQSHEKSVQLRTTLKLSFNYLIGNIIIHLSTYAVQSLSYKLLSLMPNISTNYKQLFLILAFLSSASAMGSTAVTPPYLLWIVLFLCWASSSLVVPLNLHRVQW